MQAAVTDIQLHNQCNMLVLPHSEVKKALNMAPSNSMDGKEEFEQENLNDLVYGVEDPNEGWQKTKKDIYLEVIRVAGPKIKPTKEAKTRLGFGNMSNYILHNDIDEKLGNSWVLWRADLPVPDVVENCVICGEGHQAFLECPWIYSRCKKQGCNGIMILKVSSSEANPNRLFLSCQYSKCDTFKWLSDAIKESKCESGPSFNGGCFGWWKECPWRTTNCGCGAPRNLCTSKTEATKGQKFLKCVNSQCLKFVWLKEAMQAEENNSDEEKNKNGQLNVKMTVSVDLNYFCRGFKGKTTLG
ncbi:hypothetical protein GIB67_038478 [Kingdonia uniflora]|uniref:GRF-type domain-containing protein n=1 Tax=Kingdonia uniflora TaxID=39325 RepID=A0A7J7NP70_9MAGN|nr:hypothetical protein GIB67_038478 [Kingdonia uniflora]